MRKVIGCSIVLALLSLALSSLGDPAKEPVYSSEKPAYVKVALNEGGSKVLSVVFDESKGTGKGYDMLYADVDFSGRLDKGKKLAARISKCTYGIHCNFPAIELNVPSSNGPSKISDPCEVIFNYSKHSSPVETSTTRLRALSSTPATTTTESFTASSKMKVREGSARWEYSFRGDIKPSENLKNAPVWNFLHAPKMKITAKPDDRKKGNLGVGLELLSGEINVEGNKAGVPLKAHVEIKKPNGRVVHRADGNLDKFGFG